jgi:hypothetical protein
MADTKFKFGAVKAQLSASKREAIVLLTNQAQNYFLSSFKTQGFDGEAWKEVKRRTPGTTEYKYPAKPKASSRTSPILIRTGTLRRAVSTMARTAQVSDTGARMIVDLPYAKAQNEGSDKKNIPKREYVGQTEQLTVMQKEKIDEIIKKIWKV